MNSGRIAIGLVIIIALAAMLVFKTSTMPAGYAATSVINATSASVTVNGMVEVLIQNAPVTFGALDPGITNSAATNNPMNVTFTGNTNVGVETYLNGSRFEQGANNFLVPNMSYNVSVSGTGIANTSCSTARCRYGTVPAFVFNETAPLSVAKNASIYHYIDIPSGQAPDTYTGGIRVCTEMVGVTACRT
jgi:hypothetical protein